VEEGGMGEGRGRKKGKERKRGKERRKVNNNFKMGGEKREWSKGGLNKLIFG
jgi:hypothetical protein